MQETQVQSLGPEDSPGVGNGIPLQCSCLGKFHVQMSEAGYSPWSHKESDTADRLTLSTLSSILELLYKMLVIGSIKHIYLLSHTCGGSKSKSRFHLSWILCKV